MKLVIDSGIPYIQGVFEDYFQVEYISGQLISKDNIVNADALIIRTRTICNRDLLEGSSVKIICSATIGYDHIDTAYCESVGIKWHTVPGCNAESVVQYVLSALAYLHKRDGLDFSNLTLGVIGYGNVGKALVKKLKYLGIKTLINDPLLQEKDAQFQSYPLVKLLTNSDIISIHTPLTHSGDHPTYKLVNSKFISYLKPNAVLINSSRGEVIDEIVLENLLGANRMENIILDVWNNEPKVNPDFVKNILLSTPHIAGYSADGKYNGSIGCIEQVSGFFGLPSLTYKASLPLLPKQEIIELEVENRSFEDVYSELIEFTYSINRDNLLLKQDCGNFELIRNNYPMRREFGAYTLKLIGSSSFNSDRFYELGFKKLQS